MFAVIGAGAGRLQEFADHSLVHLGVLAQVECRQVEAEDAGRTAQRAQAATRQQL